eukprot:CAMPEP_0177280430 /NCGR_PEP_ID=MMETSP0367-20130122/70378_1 /TAXON_ID=447022 ORGANISM="Scrippsiella hangoei-like, Strain SHHI-4" /NCGR_SAMPLE_ID=MMETSP0367 /ASSEMBLY_ACC=CAM_ASM_000362 /LENGTH=81 /DNA_ID=CAMNT_0018737195 /DNA_START=18 /DNA_END=259 /DNA_ORIENTATION=-
MAAREVLDVYERGRRGRHWEAIRKLLPNFVRVRQRIVLHRLEDIDFDLVHWRVVAVEVEPSAGQHSGDRNAHREVQMAALG